MLFLASQIPAQSSIYPLLYSHRVCQLLDGANCDADAVFLTAVALTDLKSTLSPQEWAELWKLLQNHGFPSMPISNASDTLKNPVVILTQHIHSTGMLLNDANIHSKFDALLARNIVLASEYAQSSGKRLSALFSCAQTVLQNRLLQTLFGLAQTERQECNMWKNRAELLSHTIAAKLSESTTKKIAWDIMVDSRLEKELSVRKNVELQLAMFSSRSQVEGFRLAELEQQVKILMTENADLKTKATFARRAQDSNASSSKAAIAKRRPEIVVETTGYAVDSHNAPKSALLSDINVRISNRNRRRSEPNFALSLDQSFLTLSESCDETLTSKSEELSTFAKFLSSTLKTDNVVLNGASETSDTSLPSLTSSSSSESSSKSSDRKASAARAAYPTPRQSASTLPDIVKRLPGSLSTSSSPKVYDQEDSTASSSGTSSESEISEEDVKPHSVTKSPTTSVKTPGVRARPRKDESPRPLSMPVINSMPVATKAHGTARPVFSHLGAAPLHNNSRTGRRLSEGNLAGGLAGLGGSRLKYSTPMKEPTLDKKFKSWFKHKVSEK